MDHLGLAVAQTKAKEPTGPQAGRDFPFTAAIRIDRILSPRLLKLFRLVERC